MKIRHQPNGIAIVALVVITVAIYLFAFLSSNSSLPFSVGQPIAFNFFSLVALFVSVGTNPRLHSYVSRPYFWWERMLSSLGYFIMLAGVAASGVLVFASANQVVIGELIDIINIVAFYNLFCQAFLWNRFKVKDGMVVYITNSYTNTVLTPGTEFVMYRPWCSYNLKFLNSKVPVNFAVNLQFTDGIFTVWFKVDTVIDLEKSNLRPIGPQSSPQWEVVEIQEVVAIRDWILKEVEIRASQMSVGEWQTCQALGARLEKGTTLIVNWDGHYIKKEILKKVAGQAHIEIGK